MRIRRAPGLAASHFGSPCWSTYPIWTQNAREGAVLARDLSSWPMPDPGHVALGAWSGGRFMHFGEELDDERLVALLRPDDDISTVLTADVYGAGEADSLVGPGAERAAARLLLAGGRDRPRLLRGRARRAARVSALHGSLAARRGAIRDYLRIGRRARAGAPRGRRSFDLLLLHNPDRAGYTQPGRVGGDGRTARRGADPAGRRRPGPANGFTLDLIECFERFGSVIDWAMVILNPLEPWPGELCLGAAQQHDVKVITRVVDYGGLFHDDVARRPRVRARRPPRLPARRLGRRRAAAGWSGCGRSPSATA